MECSWLALPLLLLRMHIPNLRSSCSLKSLCFVLSLHLCLFTNSSPQTHGFCCLEFTTARMLLTLMSHDTIPGLSNRLEILAPKQPIDMILEDGLSGAQWRMGTWSSKKQQHPTRSFQASLSSCSQRGFNIWVHACAPKRASTWWVCAWKLQGCARCALKTTDIPWFLFQMLKSREWRATPDTLTPCQAPKIGSRWALISSAEISRRTCGVQYTVLWKGQASAPDSRLSPTQKWACIWALLVVAPVNHNAALDSVDWQSFSSHMSIYVT